MPDQHTLGSDNGGNGAAIPKVVARPPQNREIARPVANLGNTCYMNAVLQALAHAPELCMAMDVEPHCVNCKTFNENSRKRAEASPSSSPDAVADIPVKPTGTRKSRRSGKRSPTSRRYSDGFKFCALCEVEQHLARVHSEAPARDRPVAPTTFVHGFIDQVAPWFKLGQQEDSHEFLRILIDAMQKSCQTSRPTEENPQDAPPGDDKKEEEKSPKDTEYPFQLFRGTVESNVTCASCGNSGATRDPIEDIGLDVTPAPSSEKSSSATSSVPGQLADVGSALQRFARAEALDSAYKCEHCGKVGSATKQSRLASIPPILTLHLKRFRYGGDAQKSMHGGAGQSTRRSNRSSEVSQLLGSSGGGDYLGRSGSAKIEGHSKFEQVLDLKPYLTENLQAKHSNMYCRLFAVIVHAGKNSHSGHYISYVRNILKNEWWKMDDARVTTVSFQEVMNAEAYMLFYRVVDHPFSVQLRAKSNQLRDDYNKQVAAAAAAAVRKAAGDDTAADEKMDTSKDTTKAEPTSTAAAAASSSSSADRKATASSAVPSNKPQNQQPGSNNGSNKNNSRKRKAPDFTCGEDWARAKSSLPEAVVSRFRDIENTISEYVQFKPEFFKLLTEQASKGNAKVGHGPSSGVCEDDIVEGTGKVKRALLELFFQMDRQAGGEPGSFLKRMTPRQPTSSHREKDTPMISVTSMVDAGEEFL